MVLSPSESKKPPTNKQAAASRGNTSSNSTFGALKLQKGAKPLAGKQFFFDIRNHSSATRLESIIKSYGGVVNPFLGKDIDLVITDRAEWGGAFQSGSGGSPLCAGGTPRPSPSPSPLPPLFSPAASPAGNSRGSNFSPATLDSPGESYGGGRRQPKSRAEAMLEKVRSQPLFRTRDPLVDAQNWGLTIWSVEKFLKLLHRVAQSLKKTGADTPIVPPRRKSDTTCSKVKLRSGKLFIKVEAVDRKHRPSYKDLPFWPSINLESEPGTSPFALRPSTTSVLNTNNKKTDLKANKETQCKNQKPVLRRSPRKKNSPLKPSPSKRNVSNCHPPRKSSTIVFQDKESVSLVPPRPPSKRHPDRALFPEKKKETETHEPLPGYCEICKVDYQDLRRHCGTDAHRQYSLNAANYAQLDSRINSQSLNLEAYLSSLLPVDISRSSKPEAQGPSATSTPGRADEADGSKMRQPVDDRHISSKMVGRKEALEVQCNGISNHVQTRFTCNKGDRENLGGIFLDERLTAVQLRKRRSISVSCKDLLEIAPGTERTHYLRSGRPARSELSQLSPALSDNSHPLLNSNGNQPLLSPTLSERGHNLRPRSQLWPNVIEEDPLLVTANNHSEKVKSEKAVDKSDKVDKAERSTLEEDTNIEVEEEKEKEVKERELRPPQNHSRNRSIRRKRLSAEEKLIEDNRGYYKVEVLNSKLRSTGYFVQQHNADGAVNGGCAPNGPSRSGSQEEKGPVVVRFKKVRRSELSVLSDEAENFMFGEQTRSESNSENSSESEEEEEDGDEEEEDEEDDGEDDDDEGGGTDSNGINENGTDSSRSRSSQRNGRRSSSVGRRGRDRLHRLKIKVGNDSTYTRCGAGESGSSSQLHSSESNGYRRYGKRRTQAEAFITDNLDYYKFEMSGSRLRVHGSPNSTGDLDESSSHGKFKLPTIEDLISSQVIDSSPCPIEDLHFSFETAPSSEVWFQTFQRQDRGEELAFPSVGEPSSVILPYQVPRRALDAGLRGQLGRRRTKSNVRLPRKSPRCHASTLAILSSVVKRRSSKEPEKGAPADLAVVDVSQAESKSSASKQPQPSTSASDQQAAQSSKEECIGGEEEIQEIARNIDSMLGLVPSSVSDFEKDPDSSQPKPCGKGRGRKKQTVKSAPVNVVTAPDIVPDNDREKDPSLSYLVDPAVLEELSCTCDVVSDPRGGPTMDILSLLDSYSDCCCIVDDLSSVEPGVDASCNSSECGTSSTCEADRRLKKKRKRRNMTGWDKPKRRCLLRRDALGAIPEEIDALKDSSSRDTPSRDTPSKDSLEESEPLLNSTDSETGVHKVPNSISSSPAQTFQRKCGNKRKLRSSIPDSLRKSNASVQPRVSVMKIEKDGEVAIPAKKRKSRKVRRLGWSKAR